MLDEDDDSEGLSVLVIFRMFIDFLLFGCKLLLLRDKILVLRKSMDLALFIGSSLLSLVNLVNATEDPLLMLLLLLPFFLMKGSKSPTDRLCWKLSALRIKPAFSGLEKAAVIFCAVCEFGEKNDLCLRTCRGCCCCCCCFTALF